jgi:hypothetical protein
MIDFKPDNKLHVQSDETSMSIYVGGTAESLLGGTAE